MTKKTNVILKFTNYGVDKSIDHLRVKLDSKDFPYVVIRNEKILITTAEDFDYYNPITYMEGRFEVVENREYLQKILSNPELTVDKISYKDWTRISTTRNMS